MRRQILAFSALGDLPVSFLTARLKEALELKPDSKARLRSVYF